MKYFGSIYTRAYRLPSKLKNLPDLSKNYKSDTLKGTFDSRYFQRGAVAIFELEKLDLTLQSSGLELTASLEILCHHFGHAVAMVTLKPTKPESSIEDLENIQNHWIAPRPECEIFKLGETITLSINDLCNIAIVQFLGIAEIKMSSALGMGIDNQAKLVKSIDSIEALYSRLGKNVQGFYIPNIFGCITIIGCDDTPNESALMESQFASLLKGSKTITYSDPESLLYVERNSAVILTKNPEQKAGIFATQFAMLNFVRHMGNYVCGELNQTSLNLHKNGKKVKLLEKVKGLFQDIVLCYDEINNLSLWNSPELVALSNSVRKSDSWRLNEEVEAMHKKLDQMTELTTEVCKIQSAKQRKHVSILLTVLGVINLLQLIPIWEDHVKEAIHFWGPIVAIAAIIASYITYKIDDPQ